MLGNHKIPASSYIIRNRLKNKYPMKMQMVRGRTYYNPYIHVYMYNNPPLLTVKIIIFMEYN